MNIAIFQRLLTKIDLHMRPGPVFTFDLVLSTTTIGLFIVLSIACYINNIDNIDARLFLKKQHEILICKRVGIERSVLTNW